MNTSLHTIPIALLTLALATLACNLGTTSTPQVNSIPTNTVQATAPANTVEIPTSPVPATSAAETNTPAGGVPFSSSGFSMKIPNGLATGANTEEVPAASGTDLPSWQVQPASLKTSLEDYPLEGKFFEPQIFIYPADEFSQMNDAAGQTITDLKTILASPSSLPDHLPFLPLFNAAQVFTSNAQVLAFQNGTGIRYLTQFDQAPLPVNNTEMFYTFQGLTTDGKYYVSAILPANAAFLSENGNPDSPVPPEGVPFDWNNLDSMPAYVQALKQRLEATEPNGFNPPLPALDALIQSINVISP
jgi:hypothetical protein